MPISLNDAHHTKIHVVNSTLQPCGLVYQFLGLRCYACSGNNIHCDHLLWTGSPATQLFFIQPRRGWQPKTLSQQMPLSPKVRPLEWTPETMSSLISWYCIITSVQCIYWHGYFGVALTSHPALLLKCCTAMIGYLYWLLIT